MNSATLSYLVIKITLFFYDKEEEIFFIYFSERSSTLENNHYLDIWWQTFFMKAWDIHYTENAKLFFLNENNNLYLYGLAPVNQPKSCTDLRGKK